ncbi:hypothetical protein AURDEDRAFT_184747 [Auricularia subglabra TFB-10046 SS5]|nr:hypothetical protein AURDEDRAFT_184747 [Auricularia subglabra TFB-10046 SS5]
MGSSGIFDIPAIIIDRPIPEPGKPGVKWWTQSARRWLNQNAEQELADDMGCDKDLAFGIGNLSIATSFDECPGNSSPLDLQDLATSLTASLRHEQDMTELVMNWLDDALMSSSDDATSDEDAQSPIGFEDDSDGDEFEPHPMVGSTIHRGSAPPPQPEQLCVCPQDILSQYAFAGPREDAAPVTFAPPNRPAAILHVTTTWSMDVDSSDGEGDSLCRPARKKQRFSGPSPPRRVRKRQHNRRKRLSVFTHDLSSDEESYFSEDIHPARPMSPLTGLVEQMESCLLSRV